mgnify:FL=1
MRTFAAKLVRLLALLCFFVFGGAALLRMQQTNSTRQISQQLVLLRKAASAQEDGQTDWSKGMLDVNPDYVGWLTVYGTGIDRAVVQGESNNTYLRTDIYGQYSVSGTLFLDETVDSTTDGNVIIYGHMMQDSTMFGGLKLYKDKDYFTENRYLRWDSQTGERYYELFAGMVISGSANNTDYVNLQQWANTLTETQTAEMLQTIQEQAFLYRDSLLTGDSYIFLVTCDTNRYNTRLVLVGREI